MEDHKSTKGKKLPSIPANYVSLAQLQERWIREKERNQGEKEEQEQQQQKQEEAEREFEDRRSKGRRIRKPNGGRGEEVRRTEAGESRSAAVLVVTAGECAENEMNDEGLKEKKENRRSRKKKENAKGEYECMGDERHKLPAESLVRDGRRGWRRSIGGAGEDRTAVLERNFRALSINGRNRRDNDGYRRQSFNFNGGNSRHFGSYGRFGPDKNRGNRNPTNMIWVKKGMVTDGDTDETQSSNKEVEQCIQSIGSELCLSSNHR